MFGGMPTTTAPSGAPSAATGGGISSGRDAWRPGGRVAGLAAHRRPRVWGRPHARPLPIADDAARRPRRRRGVARLFRAEGHDAV